MLQHFGFKRIPKARRRILLKRMLWLCLLLPLIGLYVLFDHYNAEWQARAGAYPTRLGYVISRPAQEAQSWLTAQGVTAGNPLFRFLDMFSDWGYRLGLANIPEHDGERHVWGVNRYVAPFFGGAYDPTSSLYNLDVITTIATEAVTHLPYDSMKNEWMHRTARYEALNLSLLLYVTALQNAPELARLDTERAMLASCVDGLARMRKERAAGPGDFSARFGYYSAFAVMLGGKVIDGLHARGTFACDGEERRNYETARRMLALSRAAESPPEIESRMNRFLSHPSVARADALLGERCAPTS